MHPNAKETPDHAVNPGPKDILCGRSRNAYNHPGNQNLRAAIALTLDEYNKCDRRQDKTRIIRLVIKSIVDDGGRFLYYDNRRKQWLDGGMALAKSRVGTAFRDASIPGKVKSLEAIKKHIRPLTTEREVTRTRSFSSMPSFPIHCSSPLVQPIKATRPASAPPHPSFSRIAYPDHYHALTQIPMTLTDDLFEPLPVRTNRVDDQEVNLSTAALVLEALETCDANAATVRLDQHDEVENEDLCKYLDFLMR